MIEGEVEWINYLHQGGARVAKALNSEEGKLVLEIEDGQGDHFLATAFEKAKGGGPSEEDITPKFFASYGKALGRIHKLSTTYNPQKGERLDCDDKAMHDIGGLIPVAEKQVLSVFRDLVGESNQFPRDAMNYGMIHGDAHTGNMIVDEDGEITLFDFDDCCRSWYINDLSIALFYLAS